MIAGGAICRGFVDLQLAAVGANDSISQHQSRAFLPAVAASLVAGSGRAHLMQSPWHASLGSARDVLVGLGLLQSPLAASSVHV